jgi:hypothetical protein
VMFWDRSSRTRRFLRVDGDNVGRESFRLEVWIPFEGDEDTWTIAKTSFRRTKELVDGRYVDVEVGLNFGDGLGGG